METLLLQQYAHFLSCHFADCSDVGSVQTSLIHKSNTKHEVNVTIVQTKRGQYSTRDALCCIILSLSSCLYYTAISILCRPWWLESRHIIHPSRVWCFTAETKYKILKYLCKLMCYQLNKKVLKYSFERCLQIITFLMRWTETYTVNNNNVFVCQTDLPW